MQIEAKQSIWTYLGDASYSLYLIHPLVVSTLLALWMPFPIPADLIVAFGMLASVVVAWRIHERFERPILQALRPTRAGRRKTVSALRPAAEHEHLSASWR